MEKFQSFVFVGFFLAVIYPTSAATIAAVGSTCPLPDSNTGIVNILIPTDSPIGRFNGMLIKFDTKRKLPFSSITIHDQLNTQKNLNRDSVAEPFGPLNQTCASLAVPSIQFNCSGGISMTDAQKLKASPRYTWDRGHLTPANPMRYSEDALNKTFYCINLAPQDSWTNQNSWMKIEVFTENKLKETNGYVMTGLCSADNIVDGNKTYKGYTVPQCFWKLACYKEKITNQIKVVGYIGNNTIVNFKDTDAQKAREATTFLPRAQSEILALVTNKDLISQGWTEAMESLLPGRSTAVDLPTAQQCISTTTLDADTATAWKL